MERRREPRLQTDQPVDVLILSDPPASCRGRVVETSGRGLRLVLPLNVSLGTAVQVEAGDALLLGEVCHHSAAGGEFTVGLALEHTVTGLCALENLRRSLDEEAPGWESTGLTSHTGSRRAQKPSR